MNSLGEHWCIIDTETDGFRNPIHIVEIAAQRMVGLERDGDPFRVFLDHRVSIPRDAVAVHGYTQRYLSKTGDDPVRAHQKLASYVGDLPLVAHNLAFDWTRCLIPEWERLGLPPWGNFGFCSARLARRVLPEVESVALDHLRSFFGLRCSRAHSALGDVESVADFMERIAKPRLESAGLTTMDEVALFSVKNPVAKCLERIRLAEITSQKSGREHEEQQADSWYYLDGANRCFGPMTESDLIDSLPIAGAMVWGCGLQHWTHSHSIPELSNVPRPPAPPRKRPPSLSQPDSLKTNTDLIEVCRKIVSDGRVSDTEFHYLVGWLEDFPYLDEWPGTEIYQVVEEIMSDGMVTMDEKRRLKRLLDSIIAQF